MQKFEYYSFSTKSFTTKLSNSELNALGSEGWELVTHTTVVFSGEIRQHYIFKRPLND